MTMNENELVFQQYKAAPHYAAPVKQLFDDIFQRLYNGWTELI